VLPRRRTVFEPWISRFDFRATKKCMERRLAQPGKWTLAAQTRSALKQRSAHLFRAAPERVANGEMCERNGGAHAAT
jgi:hypothetical protein